MFFHNFKYSFKTLFRNRMLIFWTFAFPIILGTFFNMAFSGLVENEKLDIIDIAIVNDSNFEKNDIFKKAFEDLSDENNEDRMFNTKYVSIDEAKQMLQNDEIVGFMQMKDDEPKLTFMKNGINQTIFKYVTEEIVQTSSIVSNISETKIKNEIKNENYNVDTEKIVKDVLDRVQNEEVEFENLANENLDYTMIEFYTLIAMTCLYGGILGLVAINQVLPNMSSKGKRVSVAPTKKGVMILSSLFASYVTQLIGLALLFLYTIFALKVDYGSNLGLIILLAMVGSFTGLSMGVAVGSVFKFSENAKTGILLAVTMTGCFFSGMMGPQLKYLFDTSIPFLNKVNPASMITDGYYALYYYTELDRYWFDMASLGILSFVLIAISFISLRRQKYDSI